MTRTRTALVIAAAAVLIDCRSVDDPDVILLPNAILVVAGNNQTAVAGSTLPMNPAVRVVDFFGAPMPGQVVVFAISSGSGFLTGASATTNSSGVATVGSWRLGTVGTNTLSAGVPSFPTVTPVTFTATATEPSAP